MNTLELQGNLHPKDGRSSIAVPFTVSEGTNCIYIHFAVTPKHTEGQPLPQQVSLAVYDPTGIRGYLAKPNNADDSASIIISEQHATRGSQAGALKSGEWTLLISIHRIMPGANVKYTGKIKFFAELPTELQQHDGIYELEPLTLQTPIQQAGWYRGDLHAHSYHSDGRWSPADLVTFAKAQKLDFVTLTDHDTITGLPAFHKATQEQSTPDYPILAISGTEISTFSGHTNVLGLTQNNNTSPRWFDWRKADGSLLPIPDVVEDVVASGALSVVNHPFAEGYPVCCGCRWEHADMMPGNARAIEVWNGARPEPNIEALKHYYIWLNAGHKLIATAGTDIHGAPTPEQEKTLAHRVAFNVVYAEEFSEAGIIAGLKQGHSYISSEPKLNLTASDKQGNTHMMGDTLEQLSELAISWENAPENATIHLIINGAEHAKIAAKTAGSNKWTQETFDPTSNPNIATTEAPYNWLTIEIRREDGNLTALSNPVFFGK